MTRAIKQLIVLVTFACFLGFGDLEGAEPRTILILGDSLAAGNGVDKEQAFPALIQQRIDEAKLSFRVRNGGVSGDTTAGGVRRINWLLRKKADILILELGGNDGLRGIPPETTRANLQTIIDRARKKNPKMLIVVAGMRMPDNMGKEYRLKFERVFKEIAEKNKLPLIPFLLEGVGADPRYNLPDLIHPNPEGHKIVADNVWKILEPLLLKAQ